MRTVVADVDRLRSRRNVMDDGINPFEYRDVDCSGRSLATLLAAWVGAAMVASVLLRWRYMWIALTILTLLFLFACGYAACNARRAHERVMATEEARILERRRRDRDIQSVSGAVDECSEANDPPAYQAYWITDLPPPYAVVIGAEPPPTLSRSGDSEPTTPTSGISNPPPYSVAIQSDVVDRSIVVTSQASSCSIENRVDATATSSPSTSERRAPLTDEATNSPTLERLSTSPFAWENEIKIASERTTRLEEVNPTSNPQTVLTTPTQYLNNIISCTFGRGQRRINAERNGGVNATVMTSRDRPGILQLNNQDNGISASQMSASTL